MQATKTLTGKALRAKCSLLPVTRNMEVPLNIMLNLFYSFVCSIFCYASEILGNMNAERIEQVQRKFCKLMLYVKRSAKNLAILSEFWRLPMRNERKL